jgi:hypothetical protein
MWMPFEIDFLKLPVQLPLSQAKMSCFLFYLFSLFLYKIRAGEQNKSCPGGRACTGEYGAIKCVYM